MAHAPTGVLRPHAHPWPSIRSSGRGARRLKRALLWAAVVLLLVFVASRVVEQPLRRELERRVNASLKGYTATIGRVDLRVLGLGLDLYDVTMVQNEMPSPPVVYIPRWSTSVHWRALFSGALVADVAFKEPAIYVTLLQAEQEVADPTPAEQHGWQDAITSIYPLKVNRFEVIDGSLYYWDTANPTPVHLRHYRLRAENIRNVQSVEGKYPSPVELDATLADGAHFRFDGRADLLAEPSATLRGDLSLRDLTLKALAPALRAFDVDVEGGRLAAEGRVERTAKQTALSLRRVTLEKARIDYVQRSAESEERLDKVTRAATTSEAQPTTRLDVDEAIVRDTTFGLVNRTSDPPYRVFIADTGARVQHFSNQRSERRGWASVWGTFMGKAPLRLDADFAPGARQADFQLDFRVEEVPLPDLNDVLRAKGGIDVVKGRLSLYSEMRVRNGRIEGYVKPLFADMDVYDRGQDADKNPFRQLYEALVGGGATLLENSPRDEVATVAELSGPIENPNASTFDIILGVLRNAFIEDIMPGLEPRRR